MNLFSAVIRVIAMCFFAKLAYDKNKYWVALYLLLLALYGILVVIALLSKKNNHK